MSRLKRLLKKLALALGALLIVLLLVNAILVWITGNRLEQRLAALRAAGHPVLLADLQRPALDPEKNAATFLDRAREDMAAFAKETYAVQAKPEYGQHRLDDADRKTIQAAFDAYPKLLPLLEKAADCPDCTPAGDFTQAPHAYLATQLPDVQRMRSAMNVLDAKSRLLLAEGKTEEALTTAITMLRLARHVEHEPLLIGYLVLVACRASAADTAHRALRAGPVSAKAHDALDAELAAADDSRAYQFSLRSECAFGMSAFRGFPANSWFFRAYSNDDQANEIDLIDQFVALVDKPYAEAAAFEKTWRQQRSPWRHRMSQLLTSALFATRYAHDRGTAQLRCLRVLNALQRKSGEQALADLGLPTSATTDPFNGQPLHIKKLAGGWLVYSVGKDLTDDGGKLENYTDVGLGPLEK